MNHWSIIACLSGMVAGLGAAPGEAHAQRAIGRLTPEQHLQRFENEEQRRVYHPFMIDGEAQFGVERMNLARRVIDLMEARKCDEARELARDAGELMMAQRVRRWCHNREYRHHARRAGG